MKEQSRACGSPILFGLPTSTSVRLLLESVPAAIAMKYSKGLRI